MADLAATNPKLTSGIEQSKPISFDLPCPAGTEAGDIFQVGSGNMVAFAQTDRDTSGYCSATIPAFFAEKVSVTAQDNSGDSAVAIGDTLALDSTVINKDTTNGIDFAVALEEIDAGETANIWIAWVGLPE